VHKIKNLIIPFILLLPYFIYGFISVYNGRPGGDEGIYMLSAVNVLSGKLPYRDFLSTQMPFLPYFYGMAMSIFGKGLINARWISFSLGLMAVVFVMLTCQRRGGFWAAAIAGSLLTLNKSFIFDMCSVRTQALTVFLTAVSIFFISDNEYKDKGVFLSIFMMNLAVLTRLSMLPVLSFLWLFTFFTHRPDVQKYLIAAGINVLLLSGVFVFFNQGGNLLYDVYFFHDYSGMPWAFKPFAYFMIGFLRNQFCILLCSVGAVFLFMRKRKNVAYLYFLSASYIATTLVHVVRPLSYPAYQTSNIIFIVVFIGIVLGRWVSAFLNPYRKGLFVAVYLTVAFLSMSYQEYVIRWNGNGAPPRMYQAVKFIRSIARPGDRIITCHHEIAVESNLTVLSGYEMAEFSYSPGMSDAQAQKLNMVYPKRIRQDIEEQNADIICLSPRDIILLGRGYLRELEQGLMRNYNIVAMVPQYGQFFQDLYIMKPINNKGTGK